MARSNSNDLKFTRTDIINGAFRLLGVLGQGETAEAEEVQDANTALNMMVKSWQLEDIGIWKNVEVSLFLEINEYIYNIGPTGDHCAEDAVKTEVATAGSETDTQIIVDSITDFGDTFDRDGVITSTTPAASGAITLDGALVVDTTASMTSTRQILIYSDGDDSGVTFTIVGTDGVGESQTEVITGPNATTVYSTKKYATVTSVSISGAGTGNIEVGQVGDFIGIELDDESLQWTNIAAAVSTTTVSTVDALTDDVAVDNHVYTYEAKVERVMGLVEARLHRADESEYPIDIIPREEYMALAVKTNTGLANQVYFNPILDNSELRVWPACNSVQNWIKMTVKVPLFDFDSNGDNPDFPTEWARCLKYNLAIELAPEYERELNTAVVAIAAQTKRVAADSDREYAEVKLVPDRRW